MSDTENNSNLDKDNQFQKIESENKTQLKSQNNDDFEKVDDENWFYVFNQILSLFVPSVMSNGFKKF